MIRAVGLVLAAFAIVVAIGFVLAWLEYEYDTASEGVDHDPTR